MKRSRRLVVVVGNNLGGVRSGAHMAHLELGRHLRTFPDLDVRFVARTGDKYTRFGDPVIVGGKRMRAWARRADWVIARDEPTIAKVLRRIRPGTRVLYVVHSPAGAPESYGFTPPRGMLVVWVSHALRKMVAAAHGPFAYPEITIDGNPIDLAPFRTTAGHRVTQINLSARKGARVFWACAAALPQVPFLGVRGWGDQIIPDRVPANVVVMDRVPDPRRIYERTRVLLLPSAPPDAGSAWTEAWNRVGIEAAASGIPAIAHPLPGIRASLSDAATYIDRDDVDGWIESIARHMADTAFHVERSRVALRRADHVAGRFAETLARYARIVRGDVVDGVVHRNPHRA